MPSQSVKRQRKRRRHDADGDPEFQVAPMVDVLLVLLLFFMAITSTEVLKKDKNIQLADAKHGKKPDNKKNETVVNIGWNPATSEAQFSADGKGYPSAESLTGYLASKIAKNPATYVLIRADKGVQYSNVSDLMNACAGAGIGTVTFAVITGGDSGKDAPAPPAGGVN